MSWNQIAEMLLHMLDASKMTLLVFVLTLAFALPLGMLVAVGRMSKIKIISWIIQAYLLVMRGTPLILQLIFFYFAPDLIGIHLTRFQAAIVAFTLNYAAYFSEIYRGGIEAIPKGQYEAGQVLGMTKNQIFFKVVLLQVVKRIVPPMSNEIITLVKDTSLARIIAVYELIWSGQTFVKQGLIWPLFSTGLFFLLFNGVLTLLFGYIERKLDFFKC